MTRPIIDFLGFDARYALVMREFEPFVKKLCKVYGDDVVIASMANAIGDTIHAQPDPIAAKRVIDRLIEDCGKP